MTQKKLDDQQLVLHVIDMTCDRCERNVERACLSVPGVTAANANFREGTVLLSHTGSAASVGSAVERAIEQAGYTVERVAKRTSPLPFIVALALAFAFERLSLTPAFRDIPVASAGMGAAGYAALGLLTSTHCVAMCGGLVLLGGGASGRAVDVARYHMGRLVGYAAVGALLGAVGKAIQASLAMRAYVGCIAALFMLVVGASLTGLAPWAKGLQPLLPEGLRDALARGADGSPLLVGLANALMPCGPLQAMQLVAMATGSPAQGALDMASFCLGTMPLMVGLGVVAQRLTGRGRRGLAVVGGTVVMAFGCVMLVRNLALVGVRMPFAAQPRDITEAVMSADGSSQRLATTLQAGSYPNLTVQAGTPVVWQLTASEESLNGCNAAIVMPEWDVYAPLEPGVNEICFTPSEQGSFGYSCWMGMIRATVTVE